MKSQKDIRNPLSRVKVTRLGTIFSDIVSRDGTIVAQSTFADNRQRPPHDVVRREVCRPGPFRTFCHYRACSQCQRYCRCFLGTSLCRIVPKVIADELQAVRRGSSREWMTVTEDNLPNYSLSREEEQRRKNKVLEMHRRWYLEEWELLRYETTSTFIL